MLSLEGNTAVYLLYAHARIASIVRKSGVDVEDLKKSHSIKVTLIAYLDTVSLTGYHR